MSDPSSERVLVVPGSELDRLGRFQGFHPDAGRYLQALLVPQLMEYRPRSEVEEDPSWKQIIPYVVLRCGRHASVTPAASRRAKPGCIVCGRSASAGTSPSRTLKAGKSLDAYEMAMRRELDEEVEAPARGDVASRPD